MAREQDRYEDKQRQLRRWQRAQRHMVSRDEELRRKQAAKAARAARKDRPRDRAIDDDETAGDALAPMRARARTPRVARPAAAGLPHATVTAVHKNGIELDGVPARLGSELLLDPALRPVVGDVVAFVATEGPPRAVAVLPRRSWLGRPDPGDERRELVLAANVDVAVIVVAAQDPPPRPGLIDRCLVAVQRTGIAAVVCVNKVDLLDAAGRDALAAMRAPYAQLAVPVVQCSADTGEGLEALREALGRGTAVLLGHSGVGKSSLLNALDPDGHRRVGAVRAHDGRGRHTTTAASMRRLRDGAAVIDTPGVRAFGLDAPTRDELDAAFPELAPFAAACRFHDCTHVHEPACGVRDAAASGRVAAARYASWCRILSSPD
jgi:ribosome biogenesis GTPase